MTDDKEQLKAAAAELRDRARGKMGHIWWTFMLRGLLALGLGVAALIWPGLTLSLLVSLVGIYALLDGAAGIIGGLRSGDLQSNFPPAIVSLVVGAILLLWPGLTVKWLLIILGFFVLMHGASLFLAGRSTEQDDPDRGLLTTTGIALAVVGLVLIFWPGAGAVTISWLVAALAFVVSAVLIYLALSLRRVTSRINKFGKDSRP